MTALSAVEFLIWLLMVASAISLPARRLHVLYTVALVAGGLILSRRRRLNLLEPMALCPRRNPAIIV